MTAFLGGLASLGLGGAAMARTGSRELEIAPTGEAGITAALDDTDAAFTQYRHRPPPPVARHPRRQRRRVVRNGRVYYVS